MGNGKWEMEHWKMSNVEREMGNEEWEMGNEKWVMRNGKWGTTKRFLFLF